MRMSTPEVSALRDHLAPVADRAISDPRHVVALSTLATQSCLGRGLELVGRSVLLATSGQLLAGLAMIEIDGVAQRMVLCPPDLKPDHLASVMADAGIDAVVTDQPERFAAIGIDVVVPVGLPQPVEA